MKSISVTFDTVIEMINDTTISSGMTVSCLGYESMDDHNGGLYRIFSSLDSDSDKTEDDITFVCDDKLFARKVENDFLSKLQELGKRIDTLHNDFNKISDKVDSASKIVNTKEEVKEETTDKENKDSINPYAETFSLDLLDKCGIKITSNVNGTKSVFIDRFYTENDNRYGTMIEIDSITNDYSRVIIGKDVYAFNPDFTYIDHNNTIYSTENGNIKIKFGSVAIDSITEDNRKVIIDGIETSPVINVIYSTADDTSYVFSKGIIKKVTPIDGITEDKRHVIIMYEEIDPIKDVTYIDAYGHEYTYDGSIIIG